MTSSRWILAAAAAATPLVFALAPSAAAQQPLTLHQAIELAQRQSYQARSAQSTLEGARDRDHLFNTTYLPSLTLGGTTPRYTRQITPVIQPDGTTQYLPLQETDADLSATIVQRVPWTNTTLTFSSGISQVKVSGVGGFQSWSSTPFSVGISQPILHSNSFKWDIRQQDLRMESSERQYLEAREDVAITTTNAFFDLYAAEANLKNAKGNAAVNDTLYTLNKGRLTIGKIGENDLLQSELALLRARQSAEDAQLAYDRTLAQFRLTINVPQGTPLEIAVTADVPTIEPDTAEAVKWARANSSTIENVVASEVAADREVSEAKWNSGAGGTVNASYGYNGTATSTVASDAYKNLLNAQQLSLSVQLPLWQWGAHAATVDAAKADRDAARSNAAVTRAQVDQNAHFDALQVTEARRSLVIAAKADTVATNRFDVAYNRYVIGRITIDNLYIAQSEKDQALVAFAQALRGYWTAYYQLRRDTLYDFDAGRQIREFTGVAPDQSGTH
ncbi:MAG TPA: TolC family protein [Gemmatimonadales bacterium]|jgi:outer membrane protein TolC